MAEGRPNRRRRSGRTSLRSQLLGLTGRKEAGCWASQAGKNAGGAGGTLVH